MSSRRLGLWTFFLCAALLLATALSATAANVPRMSSDELKSRLGESGLVILDARQPADWSASETKIAGAQRIDPNGEETWLARYTPDQTLVIYCS